MLITDEKFFGEVLDPNIPALSDLQTVYRKKGLAAAEKQFADYIRGALAPEKYFRIPYYERENPWAYPHESDIEAAERILSGSLMSCGYMHTFLGGVIDWECNPTYNGYTEWTWQLSRHHEFRCLGKCYRDTGDEKFAKGFADLLMSWCEQAVCPENANPYTTKCWRTIEAGIRMTKNWHYAFFACYRSPHMTDHVITVYMKSVWEHAFRLFHFSTKANWLIMEMSGLAHIAMLYPFFRDAKLWGDHAFRVLEDELERQVYPDGFQYELSTGYHNVVIQNYHWVLCTARAMEYPIPTSLTARLETLFELNVKLCCPDGRLPDLNDGGRAAISLWCRIGLAYFPQNEVLRYFATEGKEGSLPSFDSVALPYAGMAVMRTGWSENDVWLFLDAGPFGSNHQHEDKLNVLMHAYGKAVLRDCGNYDYDTSEMRKFILSSLSHNCSMVDGLAQCRRKNYRWKPEMIARRSDMKWRFTEDWDSAEGIYNEGYGEEGLAAVHKRKVIFFKKGIDGTLPFAVVCDRLFSDDGEEHTFTVSYQMDVQPYTVSGCTFTADMGDGVSMNIVSSVPPEIVLGQKEPFYMGWRPVRSPIEHEHDAAPCLCYADTGTETRIVTVLYPSDRTDIDLQAVYASKNPNDTEIRLLLHDGRTVRILENDYPCAECEEAPSVR